MNKHNRIIALLILLLALFTLCIVARLFVLV